MQSNPDQASLRVFARRVCGRWKPAAYVFCGCFALVAIIAMLLPSKYESHLKVVVKNERVDPLIGADKQTQGVLYVNEISEARINTEIQLLLSQDVLREVVTRANLADSIGMNGQPEAKREEAALLKLQRDLTVNAVRNSNVIEASYESRDPERAADVLQRLSEAYMHSHRRVHGVPGSYAFFQRVSAGYAADLATAEADLSSFGRQHHIVTMPEQKTLALSNLSHLEAQSQESAATAQKGARTADELKKEMAALPDVVERERKTLPSQAMVDQLNTLLIGLQNKRTQAAFRYQPEDRVVRELDVQIAQTQSAIADAKRTTAVEVQTGANPALDYARSEFVRTDAEHAGEEAKTKELNRQVHANRAELMQLDAQTIAYGNLTRRVADLTDLDQMYRRRADEARLAELLDEQQISNLAVIEEPVAPQIPSSPKRGLILAVGLLWSVLLACGCATGLELMTERIHSPFALEQAAGVPVLATVPASAIAPSFSGAFPALYLSMQRPAVTLERRLP